MTSNAQLLLSIMTSAAFLIAVSKLSNAVSNTPAAIFAFLMLIPTLVSTGVVSEGFGRNIFAQLWATGRWTEEHTITPADALADAYAELLMNLSEISPQHGHGPLGRPFGSSNERHEVVSSSASGSSLYEQVKGSLINHSFSMSKADAPMYLMDLTTGYFLRATQHRKLVLTSKPSASCLFFVEKGKTHHWGFRAVATHRYIGQNIVQKVVTTSKKLHIWEAFRVLQRPGDKGVGVCSPQVYLILCSARFGKGMWLANKLVPTPSAYSAPAYRRDSAHPGGDDDLHSKNDRTNHGLSRKRDVFLSKHFGHAIGLTYSSDLSALMAAARDAGLQVQTSSASCALSRAQTGPHSKKGLRHLNGSMLQTTMSTMAECGDARLDSDADTDAPSERRSLSKVNDGDSKACCKAHEV